MIYFDDIDIEEYDEPINYIDVTINIINPIEYSRGNIDSIDGYTWIESSYDTIEKTKITRNGVYIFTKNSIKKIDRGYENTYNVNIERYLKRKDHVHNEILKQVIDEIITKI